MKLRLEEYLMTSEDVTPDGFAGCRIRPSMLSELGGKGEH